MADYVYTLTRHRWFDDCYMAPEGAVATIDLRSLVDCGVVGAPKEMLFCAMPVGLTLDNSHHVLGRGDLRELKLAASQRSLWRTVTGYQPAGDTLNDWLADHLMNAADPLGQDACKPLMPTVDGRLEIMLPGHSRVWSQNFTFGVHPHTNRVQAVLQRDFDRLWEATNGNDHCRRVLDYQCEKYRVVDWRELVPQRLRAHVPGRLPHATTITDNFDGTDGSTIGNLLTWTEDTGDWTRASNRAVAPNVSTCHCHATSALSGTDAYSQVSIVTQGGGSGAADRVSGPSVRWSDASNFYFSGLNCVAAGTTVRLYKRVATTNTQVGTDATVSVSLPQTAKTQANGSTIDAYWNGSSVISQTDTALSAGTLAGLWGRNSATGAVFDDFEAADLAAGSVAGRLIGGRLIGGHLTRSRLVGI